MRKAIESRDGQAAPVLTGTVIDRTYQVTTELLIIDDLFLRKLPTNAGDELADVLMSR